ncbi:MAG: hypothetical protein QW468_05320, partial [Candidatus Bathyarchaeia archaeon]
MIEQYTITTTPKYNFPHPTTDTTLPQRLIELSIHSLKNAVNTNSIQLNQQTIQQPFNNSIIHLSLTPIPLSPKHDATTIAAIDTSSMKIGETATGTLIAIR